MARFFNTAGPVAATDHYMIDPLSRLDRDELLRLIDQKKYFVLHAPRQTGKTTTLLALVSLLNREGRYAAAYCNVEAAQVARNDVDAGIRAILAELGDAVCAASGEHRLPEWAAVALSQGHAASALTAVMRRWAETSSKPTIVVFDEVDSLVGDTLVSLLRQVRTGYHERPARFPHTVILCGVRDVRDYRIETSEKQVVTGGSAFNVRAKSLRLGDLSRAEIQTLYGQHAEETGQAVCADAVESVWELTRGQPWLVNALGYEACFEMPEGRERGRLIDTALIAAAKDRVVGRRETHLDQLVDKLKERRVHGVVAPMLAGARTMGAVDPDDVEYVIDLGLVRRAERGLEIANAICREVIPRELTWVLQDELAANYDRNWYIDKRGRLQTKALLEAFQQFFRENAEHWVERLEYREAGPQLLLQAFLQRVVNGGGRIDREYGLGRGRTDLLVRWPTTPQGFSGQVQTVVIELKVLHRSRRHTIEQGLTQIAEYLDRTGAAEGHLLVFDRRPVEEVSWDEKVFARQEEVGSRNITVWGM